MATQPTQNPVPSESPRDLKFNAGKIDEFVTSLINTYIDRFGNQHYTIEGLRWLARQAIADFGWIPVGTFQSGATLNSPNQIIKDETDGEYYRWDGALPKVVPKGSTPASTGGTGVGAWISVGDSLLRQQTQYRTDTIATLQKSSFDVGDFISVAGYYSAGDGANHFRVIADKDDGSGIQLANGLWANLVFQNYVHVGWFGAKQDGTTDDSDAITKAHTYYRYHIVLSPRETFVSKPLPIGTGTYYSATPDTGQQFPSGNVIRWVIPEGMTSLFTTTLTSDTTLRNVKLSSMRLTFSSKREGFKFINCDIPLGQIEADHIHAENFTYFFFGEITNRAAAYEGAFVSMGSRINLRDCTFMVDYTFKFNKGVAGSSWSNHNFINNCQVGCIDIDATLQNWNLTNCLYEARAYSNGTIGVLTLPLFIARNRVEGLLLENLYAEGIYNGADTSVSLSDWNSAVSNGVLQKTVNVFNSSSSTTAYSVYLYNDIYYVGVVSGSPIATIDPKLTVPIIQAYAQAKVRFDGGVFSAFQILYEGKSSFYTSDIEVNTPEIYDGNENGIESSAAAQASAYCLPLFKSAFANGINLRWSGNKCSYRDISNNPIRLQTSTDIRQISNYDQTRLSGNTTLPSKIKINSSTIYVTTNPTGVHGSGYTEQDPIYVAQSLAALLDSIAEHENIVIVNSVINHISIASLQYRARITLRNTTLNIPVQSYGYPYINAPHGVVIIGSGAATINFHGSVPAGQSNDYWIEQPEGEIVIRGVGITGHADSPISLVNNSTSYVPVAIRLHAVVGNSVAGTPRVYATKTTPLSATSFYMDSASSGVVTR